MRYDHRMVGNSRRKKKKKTILVHPPDQTLKTPAPLSLRIDINPLKNKKKI